MSFTPAELALLRISDRIDEPHVQAIKILPIIRKRKESKRPRQPDRPTLPKLPPPARLPPAQKPPPKAKVPKPPKLRPKKDSLAAVRRPFRAAPADPVIYHGRRDDGSLTWLDRAILELINRYGPSTLTAIDDGLRSLDVVKLPRVLEARMQRLQRLGMAVSEGSEPRWTPVLSSMSTVKSA